MGVFPSHPYTPFLDTKTTNPPTCCTAPGATHPRFSVCRSTTKVSGDAPVVCQISSSVNVVRMFRWTTPPWSFEVELVSKSL